MGYDLHTHSIYSDGTSKPAELIQKAFTRGLDGLSLTDHDTIDGNNEASEAAAKLRLTDERPFIFISGVELTTDYGTTEVHVLGYNFDLQNSKLQQKLAIIVDARNERAQLILKKLNQHRIPLTWEKVRAQTTSRFVGRTHIFKAMERAGMVAQEHRRGVFEYYLGKNGVAYVPHQKIDTAEAIELINHTGGIPVLAHPGRMDNDQLIPQLVEFGLRGLEVFYPAHNPQQVEKYQKLAIQFGLFITGGSDYHGAFSQTKLGDAQVADISTWYQLMK